MITLGIETSCDETALCLLETKGEGVEIEYRILGNIVHSQIDLHQEFGGVFPALAKREHIKNLPILFEKIIKDSGISEKDISQIAVTVGPGLVPALWTGIDFAREISMRNKIPIIPVNHMEGHIISTFFTETTVGTNFNKIKNIPSPFLALLISGGHTELVEVEKIRKYKILGRTKDDAVGEAFDKVARMLGLPYPGGPEISLLAEKAREKTKQGKNILSENNNKFSFPRPMIHSKDLNFSFSGLKTSILYTLQKMETPSQEEIEEISKEFEDAVTEVLVQKTESALNESEYGSLVVGGGVIANKHIQNACKLLAEEFSIPLFLPGKGLTGDNALMIAFTGALHKENTSPITKDFPLFKAEGNLSFE